MWSNLAELLCISLLKTKPLFIFLNIYQWKFFLAVSAVLIQSVSSIPTSVSPLGITLSSWEGKHPYWSCHCDTKSNYPNQLKEWWTLFACLYLHYGILLFCSGNRIKGLFSHQGACVFYIRSVLNFLSLWLLNFLPIQALAAELPVLFVFYVFISLQTFTLILLNCSLWWVSGYWIFHQTKPWLPKR